MAATDKTRIPNSAIKEDEQGQLVAKRGISREVVQELSRIKGEPQWMAEKRLKSLDIFLRKPIPTWGVDLSGLNLDELVLYSPPEAGRFYGFRRNSRRPPSSPALPCRVLRRRPVKSIAAPYSLSRT